MCVTDRPTDGHTLLYRCEKASKNSQKRIRKKNKQKLQLAVSFSCNKFSPEAFFVLVEGDWKSESRVLTPTENRRRSESTVGWNSIKSTRHFLGENFFPTSSGVSEWANEWAQQSARVKRAGRSEQMSAQCKWMSEWMRKWPSTYVSILGCSKPLCDLRKEKKQKPPKKTGGTWGANKWPKTP